MQSIQQLAVTGTTDVQATVPEKWVSKVEEAARAKRVGRDLVKVNRDLVSGGDILHYPKRGKLSATKLSPGTTDITAEAMSYSDKQLEPVEYGVGVRLTDKSIRASQVNLLGDANTELGEALADKEDEVILDELTSGTVNITTIGTQSFLKASILNQMANLVRSCDFEPDTVVIAPEQHLQLATQSQFIDASEYGSDEVVKNGKVARFAGMDVIVSNNMATACAWGTAGHYVVAMDSTRAGVLAVGRDTDIETDYEPLQREHVIAASNEFDAALLNDGATCPVKVID